MLDVGFLYCLCQSAFLSQLILYCIYDVKKIEQSVHVSLSMNKIKVTVDLTTPHWHLKMDICGEMLFSTCKSSSWKFNINMLEIKNHHFRWLFLIFSLLSHRRRLPSTSPPLVFRRYLGKREQCGRKIETSPECFEGAVLSPVRSFPRDTNYQLLCWKFKRQQLHGFVSFLCLFLG